MFIDGAPNIYERRFMALVLAGLLLILVAVMSALARFLIRSKRFQFLRVTIGLVLISAVISVGSDAVAIVGAFFKHGTTEEALGTTASIVVLYLLMAWLLLRVVIGPEVSGFLNFMESVGRKDAAVLTHAKSPVAETSFSQRLAKLPLVIAIILLGAFAFTDTKTRIETIKTMSSMSNVIAIHVGAALSALVLKTSNDRRPVFQELAILVFAIMLSGLIVCYFCLWIGQFIDR